VFVLGVALVDRPAPDHRLLAGDAGVERLRAGGDRADADHVDVLVVGHLLAALLALLLGRRDEAGVQRERMAVDPARVLVDVVDRELGAVGRARADVVGAALLIDEADDDRRLVWVGRAGLAPDVLHVVGDAGAHRSAAGIRTARLRGLGGRCTGSAVVVIASARYERRAREHARERERAAFGASAEVHAPLLLLGQQMRV